MGFFIVWIFMIIKDDLLMMFGEVVEIYGCYFCKYVVVMYVFYCCVRNVKGYDFVIVFKNVDDLEFVVSVVLNVLYYFLYDGLMIFEIFFNVYGFIYVMVVFSIYYGFLNWIEKCMGLFLCLLIFWCEFNGNELVEDFKWFIYYIVDVNNWYRIKQLKISVYFDNFCIGGGMDKDGVIVSLEILIVEIDNVSGVSNGFIEIINYCGEVIEVLLLVEDYYVLICNCQDEEVMDCVGLVVVVEIFIIG